MRTEGQGWKLARLFAVASSAFLWSVEADAFCRTTTSTSPADYDAVTPGCWAQGLPLYHPSQCLSYHLLAHESPVIPNAVLSDTLAKAFAAWLVPNSTCTPGIVAIELAPIDAPLIASYRVGEDLSRNLIGVQPIWKYGPDVLGLSTLVYNVANGEVYGFDTEINGTVPWSFNGVPGPNTYDLQAALTHEVGHMLGFAHSNDPAATMKARAEVGSIKQRTLTPDDEHAICTVYPSRSQRLTAAGLQPATTCNLVGGNASGSCGAPDLRYGCGVAPPSSGALPLVELAALGAFGAAIGARRVRRRERMRSNGRVAREPDPLS